MLDTITKICSQIDFPALLLAVLLLGIFWAMFSKQKDANFDWGDAFRDDAGKVSWLRAAIPISLVFSAWALVYVLMNGIRTTDNVDGLVKVLRELFYWNISFQLVWAGTKTVDKLIDLAKTYLSSKNPTPPQS
jgi:hypothetical protein